MALPPCPESLKTIAHYLKIAEEHDNRDIVIAYWCRLHALEVAIKITDTKTPEINKFLLSLMEWLENTKQQHPENEGISSKVCAQATIENYVLKLFKYADEQDRAELYGKNVVKAFYTSGILMDVLTSFDVLSEDIQDKRKYAKWKAAYIHNCLKAGERPVPGPLGNSDDEFKPINPIPPSVNSGYPKPIMGTIERPLYFPDPPNEDDSPAQPPPTHPWPSNPPQNIPSPVDPTPFPMQPTPSPVVPNPMSTPKMIDVSGSASLAPEQVQKAQKYCKWASSALNYDDVKNAIENLQKALNLLQTGKDEGE